ncbi:sugar ABC transporter ATP-binding protein [Mesorhizobium sp.]|uniref:sugar ABC transporter ATP-binding protein n=1 Tax=Mesorhizobium sp. TaxID=1871066 RepID=UPI00356902B8
MTFSSASTPALLEAKGLSKAYGRVTVLDDVNVAFRAGEIHALLGENGAGKSTLVKILAGVTAPTAGEVAGPAHANRDVAMVFQELSVIRQLSVLDNLVLADRSKGVFVPYRRLGRRAREVLALAGLQSVSLDRPVETLSLAEQQLLEIARGLMRDAKVLILDEPTATLSDVEIQRVHAAARRLAETGHAVLYITHRLGEVFQLAHHVTIMRSGKLVATGPTRMFEMHDIISHMLGHAAHDPLDVAESEDSLLEAPTLEVSALSLAPRFDDVSFSGRCGRILALFGQVGSGADDVVRALAGLLPPANGNAMLHGTRLPLHSNAGTKRCGVAYVPADRATEGVFLNASVTDNISSSALKRVSGWSVLQRRKELALARSEASKVRFAQARIGENVQAFSGGNQQKVALARALACVPKLLLMSEPTRGVDVGARPDIYHSVRQMAREGMTVVVSTSDLLEIRELADEVMTMYRGRVVGRHNVRTTKDPELLEEILRGAAA